MKKYLTLFVALVLGGCAYAEFQAGFLDQYSDDGCAALRGELSESRLALEGYAQDKRRCGRVTAAPLGAQSVIIDLGDDMRFSDLTPSGDGGPPRWWGKYHRERMQAHARHQSLLQLMTSQGCSG